MRGLLLMKEHDVVAWLWRATHHLGRLLAQLFEETSILLGLPLGLRRSKRASFIEFILGDLKHFLEILQALFQSLGSTSHLAIQRIRTDLLVVATVLRSATSVETKMLRVQFLRGSKIDSMAASRGVGWLLRRLPWLMMMMTMMMVMMIMWARRWHVASSWRSRRNTCLIRLDSRVRRCGALSLMMMIGSPVIAVMLLEPLLRLVTSLHVTASSQVDLLSMI